MDRQKSQASTQITLDDDYNVPDNKPDVLKLLIDKGQINVEEVKTAEGRVNVKGRLCFSVLYLSEKGANSVYSTEGSVPFEEFIHMDGIQSGDSVKISYEQEDLSIALINSRKLSIKAVVTFTTQMSEVVDEETLVEIRSEEPVEYRKKVIDIIETAIDKNDIYRIREIVELPAGLPNIFEVLWESIRIGKLEFRAQEQKLVLQGEMMLFLLYEAEGEEGKNRWYERNIPFSGTVDCQGCDERMLTDIKYEISHIETEVRPDADGEERSLAVDIVLNLNIRLYKEQQLELLADIYGVTKEISTQTKVGKYKGLLVKNEGKCRAEGKLRIKNNGARILQLCHGEGTVIADEIQVIENGLEIEGVLEMQILYVTTDDNLPFYSLKGSIPFRYTLDVPDICQDCMYTIQTGIEQLAVGMVDSEEIEIKATLFMQAVVFCNKEETIITDITVSEPDMDKLKALPGITGYIAKQGDSLWQIGKRYYVPIKQIKETNHLSSDEIHAGDKLLIVKTIENTRNEVV